MSSYILRQGSILHFRLRVPDDLRCALGQGEIKLTLGTGYRVQAKARALILAGICLHTFEAIRAGQKVSLPSLMETLRETLLRALQTPSRPIPVSALVHDVSTPSRPECPVDAASCPDGLSTQSHHEKPSTVLEYTVEEYLEEAGRNWTGRTYEKIRPHLYEFLDMVDGRRLAPQDLGLDMMREYKRALPLLPRNMNKVRPYRGKSLRQVMSMDVPEKHRISDKTVSFRLNVVKGYLKWLKLNYGLPEDFRDMLNLKARKGRVSSTREAFTEDDLRALFDTRAYRKGEKGFDRPWKYWIPLIGLCAGMRLTEICQLHLEDVRQVDGVWCFDVNDQAKDKTVKTVAGKRLVPIHSKLIRLGLLELVNKLTEQGHTRLFPDLTYGTHGYHDSVSKWFARYKKARGIDSRTKVFHSFRNTLSTRFKLAGVHLGIAAQIMGHALEKPSMTFDYYADGYPVEVLKQAVEMVNVTGF